MDYTKQLIEAFVTALNDRGIFSDEDDDTKCSRTVITSLKDDYLRENGYNGGKLGRVCENYGNHGFIYALYDTQRFSREEAVEYLDTVRRRAPI